MSHCASEIIEIMMNDNERWQAVLARDRSADGKFVTAVRSTGIYCRPSCPSRHPYRENVAFFDDPAAAERAGFRPCRRCRPEQPSDAYTTLAQQVCRYIEAHLDETLTLEKLGEQFHSAPDHLGRVFKRVTGISPRAYAQACRTQQFKAGLKSGDSVTGALYDAGYGSVRSAYEQSPLGMTPNAYRKGGRGMVVYYTTAVCPLGLLIAAATEKGVCFIGLGDSAEALETELMHEFPAAALQRDDQRLGETVHALLGYLAGEEPDQQLPLDVQATAFQRRVWEALRTIPYGETRTYHQIAEQLGSPNAARAVGRACATNPVSVLVPCHRVVRSGGDLNGYRWGLPRKRALLDLEAGKYTQPSEPE